MTKYIYKGDRLTSPEYKNKECFSILNDRGKCIRGRNSNMLVMFPGIGPVVVLARLLRKI